MGDRYYRYFPCPECGKEVEEYDAPSCLQHSSHCDACGWDDGLNYYEDVIGDSIDIVMCSEEKAIEEGLINKCPKCKKMVMTRWEKKEYKKCYSCAHKNDVK
jgi:uncharacterized protein (DUF983 family)